MVPLRPLPGNPARQRCLSAVPSGRSLSPVEVRGGPQGGPGRPPPSPRRAPRWPPEVLRFLEADGAAAAPVGGQPLESASPSGSGWRLAAGACKIPHPAKAERNGGDDGFFIAEGGLAVGVAEAAATRPAASGRPRRRGFRADAGRGRRVEAAGRAGRGRPEDRSTPPSCCATGTPTCALTAARPPPLPS
ncbi:unnamed protein product [Prorocentrum cordatum]|uniref:Uncharacterized protein n=1 Tax=Prorocentrum cordatum TaxID=2364126 RepID=A0ABN9VU04_9DINO|nr:unnamed protein product [Polarella glacialis]